MENKLAIIEREATDIIQAQTNTDILLKVQKFTKLLNKDVEKGKLQEFQGAKYLPISFMEMTLDEIFFGQWDTKNFKWERVFNEMIGSIELEVINPITGKTITRVGAGSIQIMQDAGKAISEFNDTKKKNALQMGFPKLKAECFKNACLSLGQYFGRDVNRKFFDSYDALIKDIEKINVEDLQFLYDMKKTSLTEDEKLNAQRIINEQEENSYNKLHNFLKNK